MTRRELLREGTKRLQNAGDGTDALDARLLLEHALGVSHEALIRDPDIEVNAKKQQSYWALIERRAQQEPIAHLLGYRDFWKDRFTVTHETLIPRPDSEALIELPLHSIETPPQHIFDLCTGSGCLLLSLLREYQGASGFGADISEAALLVAKQNALQLGLDQRAHFLCGDMLKSLAFRFDCIVCNPPYIASDVIETLDEDVKGFEPLNALDGGKDGLAFYRKLAEIIPDYLSDRGWLFVEIGKGQETDVRTFMEASLTYRGSHKDLAGITRALAFSYSPAA